MARPALLVGVWLAGVATATGVAWGAVRVVGESVADRQLGALSTRDAQRTAVATPPPQSPAAGNAPSRSGSTQRSPAAPPGGSPALPGRPSGAPTQRVTTPPTSPQSPRATTRTATFTAVGGTVAASCDGPIATMRYASPASGFASEVERAGPAEVEVRFRGADHESRVRVECVAGAPDGRVEEHGGSGKGRAGS